MISFIRNVLFFLIISCAPVWAQTTTATLLPPGLSQFFDNNGNPLTAGKVYFYIPNTLTLKTTWQNSGKTIANTNPVILDAAGRAIIYGDGSYRQILRKSDNTLIWDALTASTGSGGSGGSGSGISVGTIFPYSGLVSPTNYAFTYGQEVSRTTYSVLLGAITYSQSVNCTIGTPTITLADTTQIPISAVVELSCIAPGTTVISKTSSTVTFNNNATVSTTAVATFFPFGNGNGSTTFNIPDLRGRVIPGRDNMGGTAASILTSTYCTFPGTGAKCGLESQILTTPNLPAYTPSGTIVITDPGHTHAYPATDAVVAAAGTVHALQQTGSSTTNSSVTSISAAFTGNAQGGMSTAFSIAQPAIQLNYIIRLLPDTSGGGGGGNGNVVGPNSSTDNAIVRWDGITGALIKDTPTWLIGNGMYSFGVSGGDQGTGTINTTGFFVNAIPVVTTTGTQVLTNKTINGTSNTLTILANTQLINQVPVVNGGTGQATALLARSSLSLNIDNATSTGDANYVILSADRLVYHTALSTARTDTLPAANAVNAGQTLYLIDARGVATASNTLTLQRAGSDTLNGSTSIVIWNVAYSTAECWSDGVSRWTCQQFATGGGGGGVSSVTIAAGTNITLSGTCTITSTGTCTINAANSSPGGSNPQIQYNNSGSFGGLTDAQVAGRVIAGSSGNIQYNNAGVFGALTDTQLAARITPLNNTWTGINKFTGNTFMGSGKPWADVQSGANGCATAVGNNIVNDQAAIQCQIDFMSSTYNGGFVFFPPGTYMISTSLTSKTGVILVGSGIGASVIAAPNDTGAIIFNGTVSNGGLRDLFIECFLSSAAANDCVTVVSNIPVIIENAWIWGGHFALNTAGIDGYYKNLYLNGWGTTGGSATSSGANWYERVKFDSAPQAVQVGFRQDNYTLGAGIAENHFVNCDFSGNHTVGSIYVAANDNTSYLTITNSVMANGLAIATSYTTQISNSTLGGALLDNSGVGALMLTGVLSVGGTTVTGGNANRHCSNNVNITC